MQQQLQNLYKILHLSNLDAPYEEICKNHRDIFRMFKIVQVSNMYNFVHLEKMAPNGTSNCYLDSRFVILLVEVVVFRSHTPLVHSHGPQLQSGPHPPHRRAGCQQCPRAGRCRDRCTPPGNRRYGRSPPIDTPDNDYDDKGQPCGGT